MQIARNRQLEVNASVRSDPASVASAGIAVLTWRDIDATRRCMSELRTLNAWPVPTLIVDNGSGTLEGQILAREFGPPFEALDLQSNGGVPAGYNAALRWGMDRGLSHVLLLNNDVSFGDGDLLGRLVSAATSNVAAVGPLVLNGDRSLFSSGGLLNLDTGASGHRLQPLTGSRPYQVPWIDGSCLLISLSAAGVVGGLAPEYFMYWEETDWCFRARRAGYLCLVEPRASITHFRSSRSPSPEVVYRLRANAILFMRRNATRRQSAVWLVYYATVGLARDCRAAVLNHRNPWPVIRSTVKALIWHFRDAVSRRSWRLAPSGPDLR